MVTAHAQDLGSVHRLAADEAARLYVASTDTFAAFLQGLEPDEWRATTRCDPWTVKDIAGHLLGWSAAFSSLADLRRQIVGAMRYRKRFGNLTDAQNETQVDLARPLQPEELVPRLKDRARRAARVRRVLSQRVGFVPIFFPYLGGWQKASYLLDAIFVRDLLMHRSDCADATERDPAWDDDDRRVMLEMVSDWARRTGADVTIEFGSDDVYRAGAGNSGTIRGSLPTLALHLGKRAARADIEVEGDVGRIDRWLAEGVPV